MPEQLSYAAKARQEAIEENRFEVNASRKFFKPLVRLSGAILAGTAGVTLVEVFAMNQGLNLDSKVGLIGGIGAVGLRPLWQAISRRESEASERLRALEEAPAVAAKVIEIAAQRPDAPEAELLVPEWVPQQPLPDPLPNAA